MVPDFITIGLFAWYANPLRLQIRVMEEMQKQQAQEQILLQQYRMTNMGEMIDAIAHQWRQPLAQSNMILFTMDDNLDEESYTKEDTRKKISDLLTLTSHMSQTIDDFRNLLREDKHTANTFYADKALQEVLTLLKNNLKEIQVKQNVTEDISLIGYKNELIQVLIIIISNAIDALYEYNNDKEKSIHISMEEKDKYISISIEDNAGGINNHIIDKIFDPYFTTKEKSSGSGLGLYIAKIIVEQNMQGTLSISNSQDGARFHIRIKKKL
ncbi:sensor histidine kinase [Sulfurimonas sp.]